MITDLREHLQAPFSKRLLQLMGPLIDKGFALPGFKAAYKRTQAIYQEHPEGETLYAWLDAVLTSMGHQYTVDLPKDFVMPQKVPLVIVSNHPFGLLDPVVLGHFIASQRPDLRIMANELIGAFDEVKPHVFAVDVFGGKIATQRNRAPLREALKFLRAGGALAIFPSGEVAHYKPGKGVNESPWSAHVGSLVRRTQATVLPVYFPGQNGMLFHAAGLVHRKLRTGLIFREFLGRKHAPTEMRVGSPIPFSKLKKFTDNESLTQYLRLHTMVLAKRKKATDSVADNEAGLDALAHEVAVPATEPALMKPEVERLKAKGSVLAVQGHFSVYLAGSREIPHVMREIGRLRELTFRDVGEGTGQDIDLDKYDSYYQHIFLWDEKNSQVAGAYRLGRADLILREYGPRGLYTNTLFKFEKPFLAHLDRAVEMGRSFVRKSYQRNLTALPMLWKGVVVWMGRNPHYKKLFGPVSISKDYDKLSRKLIVDFLEEQRSHPELAPMVKPRQPFRFRGSKKLLKEFISTELQDVDDCSAVISSLETDGKGLPVLLKHYLRLNGTILSFNVDKDFSSVLDGLIMVDMTESDPRLFSKLMGEELWTAFLKAHGVEAVKKPARQKEET